MTDSAESPSEIQNLHRGVFIYIKADGGIGQEMVGRLSQAELLGLYSYASLMPHREAFTGIARGQQLTLTSMRKLADAIVAMQQGDTKAGGDETCGTDSLPEP